MSIVPSIAMADDATIASDRFPVTVTVAPAATRNSPVAITNTSAQPPTPGTIDGVKALDATPSMIAARESVSITALLCTTIEPLALGHTFAGRLRGVNGLGALPSPATPPSAIAVGSTHVMLMHGPPRQPVAVVHVVRH
jgi:hypothetical protein